MRVAFILPLLALVACVDTPPPTSTPPGQPVERDPLAPRCQPFDRNCQEP
jgi:hypothetical protein